MIWKVFIALVAILWLVSMCIAFTERDWFGIGMLTVPSAFIFLVSLAVSRHLKK